MKNYGTLTPPHPVTGYPVSDPYVPTNEEWRRRVGVMRKAEDVAYPMESALQEVDAIRNDALSKNPVAYGLGRALGSFTDD